jgi:hypothetical protein
VDLFLFTAIFEHLRKTLSTITKAGASVGGMHVLVQLAWIGDTRLVQGLSSANESPKGSHDPFER